METRISLPYIRRLSQISSLPRPKVVDDVKETEAPSEQEHRFVLLFCHSDFTCRVSKAGGEVVFDQIQVVTARVEPDDRTSSGTNSARTWARMFFPRFSALP